MLTIPTQGFRRSIQCHNISSDLLCDWIEASILLIEPELSLADIADVLVEEEVYENLDFAREGVQNAWAELLRRQRWIGSRSPFVIDRNWVRLRNPEWKDEPAYTFCILLSLAKFYDWWKENDYNDQGDLFELLTKKSIEAQFDGWLVYQTGWTRTNTAGFENVVDEVAEKLSEPKGRHQFWTDRRAKDKGLDLLWYKQFPDNLAGIPVYLVQCASGANWKSKLKTPDINIWRHVIQFTTMPKRAFSTPFSFLEEQFYQNCVIIDGILLDRCRLLNASRYNEDWVSESLKDSIIAWAESRVTTLLDRST